jgi:hypothetical protein
VRVVGKPEVIQLDALSDLYLAGQIRRSGKGAPGVHRYPQVGQRGGLLVTRSLAQDRFCR